MGRSLVQQPYPKTPEASLKGTPVAILKPSMVVPSATYIERGQRWMEKEEAVALRDALEDMDLAKGQEEDDETRLHAAAQEEASELVWQHQNPDKVVQPDAPYKYKEHLRKNSYQHARTQSVGRNAGIGMTTGLGRDITPRSVSGGSSSSGGMHSQRGRICSSSSSIFRNQSNPPDSRRSIDSSRISGEFQQDTESSSSAEDAPAAQTSRKSYGGLSKASGLLSRRRVSGKRNISGEPVGSFTGEQIWEEPEEGQPSGTSQGPNDMPAPLRLKPKNPLNRVQFAQDLPPRSNSTPQEHTKRLSRYEIHQNPPTQSRNPAYTANPAPSALVVAIRPDTPTKDGIEIRGDDIRQATSKSLKDRSAKLPTPVVVSNKPGRPIVSFDANWKPREADFKPVEESRRPRPEQRLGGSSESKTLPNRPITQNFPKPPIPTIQLPEQPSIQVNNVPSIPTITCSDASVPTFNFPDAPKISVSAPSISISEPPSSRSGSARPLPDPKTMSSRPIPRHQAATPMASSRGHWSPAGNRATATCHQCDLPIEGRVVALRGVAQRFHPECFICYTCGTGLEALEISPEPADKRSERLHRIHRRAQGENLEEIDGQSMADDGNDKLRFFCHLDWHELYAPRCKHCTTPIIGEHAVALGHHWHYGHFFCAECGDPFEQGMTHIEKDGYAWCLRCQTKRTERQAPKCKKCRGPVIGQYVQALGGEYHDDCFKCAECNGGFDDGQIFPRGEGNDVEAVCVKCMERKWKA
jgi:hypothetical protein